jgi:hypothetical protein
MRTPPAHASATAFRRALTDKLADLAKTSKWTLNQLQRQIAYDRLLERLYLVDDGWIVKGATALLARQIGVRGTLDVDVYRDAGRDLAEAELRKAADMEIGDWFRFEVAGARVMDGGTTGVRFPVVAYVGNTVWAQFPIDLVGPDVTMTGQPENVPPLARVLMPDFEQRGYRAYPLVDHIADKIIATFQRYGNMETPSTRYKDLVDLVAIVTEASVELAAQQRALESEARRRRVALPKTFEVPDRALWQRGYPAEARRSLLEVATTLEEALALVRLFADPLLNGTAMGHWDPKARRWLE